MTKKLFSIIAFSAVFLLTAGSCGHRKSPPKKLEVSTIVVSADTLARLSDAIQCHVHVDFTCLKERKYAAVNDSLLRMGLLQPDYLSISYGPLSPKTAIPSFVRQYIRDYMEMARLIRQKEKGRSQLIGELSIKTELRAVADHYVTAVSHIAINNGNGRLTKYTIARNFDLKDGHRVTLSEHFGKDAGEKLTEKIIERLSKREDIEDNDIERLQSKGYFVGITPYPSDNFILTDDSTVFIYTPGEISRKEVSVAVEN